jgi:3-hydroxyacyl-[acyl-carrier-protein] dehydratase
MDIHEILQRLPHRYPILLVDRVISVDKQRIKAIKNVSINEPQFVGHFPHRPVMPGVMILESMAQVATLLALHSGEAVLDDKSVVYFAGIDAARFKRPVEPGDQMVIEVELVRSKAGIYKFAGKCFVGDELAAEAELMCTMRRIE